MISNIPCSIKSDLHVNRTHKPRYRALTEFELATNFAYALYEQGRIQDLAMGGQDF